MCITVLWEQAWKVALLELLKLSKVQCHINVHAYIICMTLLPSIVSSDPLPVLELSDTASEDSAESNVECNLSDDHLC